MVTFTLQLLYDDEFSYRTIAEGCTKSQLLEILDRHIMLAQVSHFIVIPIEDYIPFKEYTL